MKKFINQRKRFYYINNHLILIQKLGLNSYVIKSLTKGYYFSSPKKNGELKDFKFELECYFKQFNKAKSKYKQLSLF